MHDSRLPPRPDHHGQPARPGAVSRDDALLGSYQSSAVGRPVEAQPQQAGAAEARYRAVFASAAIGIALVDLAGRLVEGNPALLRMLGYGGDELCGVPFPAVTHPGDVLADQHLYDELVLGRRDYYELEKRYLRKDGQIAWGHLTVSLIRDATGKPQYSIGMVKDITGRKQAEALLRTVVTNAPIILIAYDRTGTITLCEGHGLALLGQQPDALVGQPVWRWAVNIPGLPEDVCRALAGEEFAAIREARGVVFETRYVPMRAPNGEVSGAIGVATEITARVRAEAIANAFTVGLSPMERDVLPWLARDELTYQQIAAHFGVRWETIRKHTQNIARKLGVATRRRTVVATARERGLL